mgnify:CR=1 FL=1
MKTEYFKVNFRLALKSKKNLVLMGLLFLFCIGFVFVVEAQNIGDGTQQWEDYRQSVSANTDYFSASSLRKKSFKRTYDNLNAQTALLAQIENGEVFNDPQMFLKSSRQLLSKMIAGYKNHYQGAPTLAIAPEYQLRQQQAEYDALYQHHIPIVMNDKSSATYSSYLLTLLGAFLFFFILFLSSDVWMVKLDHPTLLRDVPYRTHDEILSKIMINLGLVLIPLVVGLFAAYLFSGLRNGFSPLNYPKVFYFNRLLTLPLWGFVLVFLITVAVMTIFVTNLTLLLNQLTRNVYLTLFLGSLLYVLAYLPGQFLKWLLFLPSAYLNLSHLFDGTLAYETGQSGLNIVTGCLVLLLWAVVLRLLFVHLVDQRRLAR